jgi:hypothetical protein
MVLDYVEFFPIELQAELARQMMRREWLSTLDFMEKA